MPHLSPAPSVFSSSPRSEQWGCLSVTGSATQALPGVCGWGGARVAGSVQSFGWILTVRSGCFPSLDRLIEVSRQWALARCRLKMDNRSAERTALLWSIGKYSQYTSPLTWHSVFGLVEITHASGEYLNKYGKNIHTLCRHQHALWHIHARWKKGLLR